MIINTHRTMPCKYHAPVSKPSNEPSGGENQKYAMFNYWYLFGRFLITASFSLELSGNANIFAMHVLP